MAEKDNTIRSLLETGKEGIPLGKILYVAAKDVVDMAPTGLMPDINTLSNSQKVNRIIMSFTCSLVLPKDESGISAIEAFESGFFDFIIPRFAADFLRRFPTLSSAMAKYPRLIYLSDLYSTDTLTTIDQVLNLSIEEADTLIKAKPLVMDFKKKFLRQYASRKVQGNVAEPEVTSDPREYYGKFNLSPYSIDLLEKTLAGLPMKAAREIDFSNFVKLFDYPYGHVRYNVYDSVETYIGCITMEKHGSNETTIGFQYQMKFDDTFKKIEAVWDKYVKNDLNISNIIRAKYGSMQSISISKPEKPEKPQKGSPIGAWFDWYHSMKEAGFNCTLEEIALETSHNPGYIRQLHAQYVSEQGLGQPKKRPNRKTNKI